MHIPDPYLLPRGLLGQRQASALRVPQQLPWQPSPGHESQSWVTFLYLSGKGAVGSELLT